jgi:Zn-dependent metalloprotease
VAAVTPPEALGPAERALLGYEGPAALPRLYAERANSTPRPCYVVELRPNLRDRWRVFVDAADGRVIARYNATCSDGPQKADATDLHGRTRTIDTYLASGRSWMIDASRAMFKASQSTFPDKTVGTIITLDARNTDLQTAYYLSSTTNTWTDRSSVSAHATTGIVYEYFRATHGRNSIDGNGMSVISVVNVTESGQSMVNAYWNGKLVAYGNGGGGFSPLAGAVDVVTHELTHGVTEYTANLEYVSQSGALNESFSDIFGAMVDRDDWTMGEEVTPTDATFPRGTLRDMADPHNGVSAGADAWQPAHMNEYVTLPTSQDNGGVHINSGIPNRAAYLLATAIGRDKAERILYRALTVKLTSQSQFIDFRLAIVHSAEDLYGAASAEVSACRSACDQVGILDGSGTGKEGDDPAVNGADRMLALSTDPNDPFYLWIITPPATGANDFQSLTATPVDRRPSVSDDGSIAVFIDRAKNIRAIALNPAAPNEQVIQSSGTWGSIAISRDKNLIAVTTDAADKTIHVYNLATSPATLHSFTIYTPSYSGDPVPNAAQFADAMDFSHDNSTLLYDCYNLVTSDYGDIGFWEINTMDVWDPASRSFAAGRVHRVFPQESDVSIGNPVFARNKKTVFAFDLEDLIDGAWYVMATDFFDNSTKLVTQTTSTGDPGYPSYRGDDRLLSYAEPDLSGVMQIMNVDLAADAITATGQPTAYVYSATMPIWFRTGTRPVAAEPVPGAPDAAGIALDPNYPNPAARRTIVHYRLEAAQTVRLSVSDVLGREVALLDAGFRDAGEHTAAWDTRDTRGRPVPAGQYFLRLTTATGARTRIVRVAR